MQATTRKAIPAGAGEGEGKSKIKDKGIENPQRQQSVDIRFVLNNIATQKASQVPNRGINANSV